MSVMFQIVEIQALNASPKAFLWGSEHPFNQII